MKRVMVLGFLLAAACPGSQEPVSSQGAASGTAATESQAKLALGKTVFKKRCVACHGASGKGDGAAAYLLDPKPRDLSRGLFRFISSADGLPTDADLAATLRRGLPGSGMPSWAHLGDQKIDALVAYVKSLAGTRFDEPVTAIAIPPDTADDAASRSRGRTRFLANCARCHGKDGRGEGETKDLTDSWGYPLRARDYTTGPFKGGARPADIFRRARLGLPGSPMPETDIPADQLWDIVHHVRSLMPKDAQTVGVQTRTRIPVKRVAKVETATDAAAWTAASAVEIVLAPLVAGKGRTDKVSVKAIHDGERIAIRMAWRSASPAASLLRHEDFTDACAIELSTAGEEPFFGMGDGDQPVEILHWKAAWELDTKRLRTNADRYPRMVTDLTPKMLDLAAAVDAGNPGAATTRPSTVEVSEAAGQGTLTPRTPAEQTASGAGVYADGSWVVVIERPLAGDKAQLVPGARASAAFAVWQGSMRDRNGQKNVSIWHDLVLEK